MIDHVPVPPSPENATHSTVAPPIVRKRWRGFLGLTLLIVIVATGLGFGYYSGLIPSMFARAKANTVIGEKANYLTAKVIRPKAAASVPIMADQLATVEPYFRADLRARASGIVKSVRYDIGHHVKKGETLVEIDVPDFVQDIARAETFLTQREKELKVSEAKLKDAKAAVLVSDATVKQRQADVLMAAATRDLKKRRFERFTQLAKKGDVVGSLVEEEERDYLASEAAVTAANANVERSRADYAESVSRVEAAEADIELKKALIDGAKKDWDKARAVADYAKVIAPFDGVVVRRNVDPGSFVQNATTGASESLISLARVDVVTVVARFPDTYATLISENTLADVRIDGLPGVTIAAKITRFAPTVQNSDRTVRVEVDLFNGEAADFDRIVATGKINNPKGPDDPLPAKGIVPGETKGRLLPGMTGNVRLKVGGYGQSYVLPSTAVYSRNGANYLLLVEDGKTKQVPVRVQVNDGQTVRVAILAKQTSVDGQSRDVLQELTGQEEIVNARQLELGHGTRVTKAITNW